MMRAWALGLLIAAVPWAGCLGGSDALSLPSPPQLPMGLILTYEITRGEDTSTQSYVVVPDATGARYDLLPYRVTDPDFASPFLKLGRQLTPRDQGWMGLVAFPLIEGTSYDAKAGGVPVTVSVASAGKLSGAWGSSRGMTLTAVDDAGATVARLTLLEEPLVYESIETQAPDGVAERWHLVKVRHDLEWGNVPTWEIGRWWSYQAFSVSTASNVTLVHNAETRSASGNPLAVLNAQQLSQRLAATPFHTVRKADLASQSGILNNLVSKQWSWPLAGGVRWAGSTHDGDRDVPFTATAALEPKHELPDGTWTTSFEIAAYTRDGLTFAEWNYVPLVEHFTHMRVRSPSTSNVVLDWRLTGFGTGFAGDIELPQRVQLFNRSFTTGPISVEETFEVAELPRSIEMRGTAVRGEAGAATAHIQVLAPDGTVAFERTADDFEFSQVVSLVDVADAQPGTWRFVADVPRGTSFFAEVLGHWGETEHFDYS